MTEEEFQKIYKLAKDRNETELEKCGVNEYYNTYTITGWLAKEGDQKTVEFLLNKFGPLGFSNAIKGAAHGNHGEFAFKLINEDDPYKRDIYVVSRDLYILSAVQGAALGNHEKLLDQLFSIEMDHKYHVIERLNTAVEYAAIGLHLNLVNKLIQKGASKNSVVCGAWEAEIFKNVKTTADFIAGIEDAALREKLVEQPYAPIRDNSKLILQIAADYRLNYEQALAWEKNELKIWFLQGIKLVKDGTLPLNLFIEISSHIAQLSYLETLDVFNKQYQLLAKKLLKTSIDSASKKFFNSSNCFFAENTNQNDKADEYFEAINAAKERYQNRMSF